MTVRSASEVGKIREASRIVRETLDYLEGQVRPGVTGAELDRLAEEFIRTRGAVPAFKGYLGYPATLCVSINEEVVHGIPDDRSFQEGDIVGIDCGAIRDGYYGDGARTFAVGEVSDEVRRLLTVTEEALHLGIEKARAGNRIGDISHAIQSHVEAHGFAVVRELVGHGIGTSLHEDPQVPNFGHPGEGPELKAGVCLAIEPMVNLGSREVFTKRDGWTVATRDGKPSAHFEHTIVVGQERGEILSAGAIGG